jgi:hypothetical protein
MLAMKIVMFTNWKTDVDARGLYLPRSSMRDDAVSGSQMSQTGIKAKPKTAQQPL